MKKSLFTRLFKRKARAAENGRLTTDDIRRKLASYQKQEGPAVFGGAELYSVEEVDPAEGAGKQRQREEADG